MQVRAIFTVQARPDLTSATRALGSGTLQLLGDAVAPPPQITFDAGAVPVPLGDGGMEAQLAASRDLDAARSFILTGQIDVESEEEIPAEVEEYQVFADPKIDAFPAYCASAAVGTAADAEARLRVADLHADGLDGAGVAVAVMDSGINLGHLSNKLGFMPAFDGTNSLVTPGQPMPFQAPVGHGTMCAYNVMTVAPAATLLDYGTLHGSAAGGSVVGSHLSTMVRAYGDLLAFWAVAFAPGGAQMYRALVVNNSWGIYSKSWDFPAGHPGRYIDNPHHPFTALVNILSHANADIIFAAGNCGPDCPDGRCDPVTGPTIYGANASPATLTVAGCTIHDDRLGYSSVGPGIAGMAQRKPDVTGYSHFIGSEAFGIGKPDSGTSTACPIVAGCVAALRKKRDASSLSTSSLFDHIRQTAGQPDGSTGWNAEFGYGIIDPMAVAARI